MFKCKKFSPINSNGAEDDIDYIGGTVTTRGFLLLTHLQIFDTKCLILSLIFGRWNQSLISYSVVHYLGVPSLHVAQ